MSVCGDGQRTGGELCDDGNMVDTDGDVDHIVMELIEAPTLADVVSDPGPLDQRAATALAALLNVPDVVRHRGQEYRLSELSLVHHEEYCAWLKAKAFLDADNATADYPEASRRLWLSVVSGDVAAGFYDVGGAHAARSLYTVAGAVQAVWLGLRQHDPTVTREQAAEVVRAALTERDTALKRALEKVATPPPK